MLTRRSRRNVRSTPFSDASTKWQVIAIRMSLTSLQGRLARTKHDARHEVDLRALRRCSPRPQFSEGYFHFYDSFNQQNIIITLPERWQWHSIFFPRGHAFLIFGELHNKAFSVLKVESDSIIFIWVCNDFRIPVFQFHIYGQLGCRMVGHRLKFVQLAKAAMLKYFAACWAKLPVVKFM